MQLLLLKYWMDVSEGIVGLGAPASDVPATPFFPGSTKAGCVSGLHLKANLLSGRVVFTSAGAVHVGDSCGRPYFPGEGGGRQRRHHEQGMQMLKGHGEGLASSARGSPPPWYKHPCEQTSSNKYQHTETILNYNYHGKSGRVVPRSRVEK